MGMYGANVAQLRALAVQFERAADRLDANRLAVGNAIQIKAWFGPVAAAFRLRWESDYSGKMAAAARILREGGMALRRNADDQERTSANNLGGLPPGLVIPSFPHENPLTPPWQTPIPAFPWPRFDLPGRPAPLVPEPWWKSQLPQPIFPSLPGRIWPNGIEPQPFFPRFADVLEDTGWTYRDLAGLVPKVGGVLDAVGGMQKAVHGELPWHEMADLVAGGFKDAPGAVSYGIGVNVALWSDVVDLATNGDIDWSPKGMQDAFNGLFNADAWKEVGHDLVTKLPPILAGDFAWW